MKIITYAMALAIALLINLHSPAQADDHKKHTLSIGALEISGVWARATPKTAKTSAAYFVITNKGASDDTLIGVSSTISKKTEIHLSSIENGIMKMRHVGKVTIPAGGTAALKRGSYHIMFMGLHAPLKDDQRFPLTLTFEKSGSVEIMVEAKKSHEKNGKGHDKMKTH